jgi:hemerythrin-like domain-containing protein
MSHESRRRFVLGAGALLLAGCGKRAAAPEAEKPEDVSPAEDLMREHGVLNRILLVYEESVRRLSAQGDPFDAIASSADIIERFIEDYHEKLEEDFLFPRFEKANKHIDLVATLRRQHQAGRTLTDTIRRLGSTKDRQKLSETIQQFMRMYRPHEAREDTVLFPALLGVVTPKDLDALGEQFEEKEHELFGKEGFEGIVEQVARIERSLGIYDLNQFTPT